MIFSFSSHLILLPSFYCPHFTEMPRRSANKVTTAAVSEAVPEQAPKNIRKEKRNTSEKVRVVTPRTTEHSLARLKSVSRLVIIFYQLSLSQSWQVTPHFQSGQIGGGEEFDFPDENYEGGASHDTLPQVDQPADPLFLSLPTRDTVDSQISGGRALDIVHFFVVHGKNGKMQKRVCKICGQVFAQYANDCFVNCI